MLPKIAKQDTIYRLVEQTIPLIKGAAISGYKSYVYTRSVTLQENVPEYLSISNEELLAEFQKSFPDCTISFQEDWGYKPIRTLITKILIDWS